MSLVSSVADLGVKMSSFTGTSPLGISVGDDEPVGRLPEEFRRIVAETYLRRRRVRPWASIGVEDPKQASDEFSVPRFLWQCPD